MVIWFCYQQPKRNQFILAHKTEPSAEFHFIFHRVLEIILFSICSHTLSATLGGFTFFFVCVFVLTVRWEGRLEEPVCVVNQCGFSFALTCTCLNNKLISI